MCGLAGSLEAISWQGSNKDPVDTFGYEQLLIFRARLSKYVQRSALDVNLLNASFM